MGILFHNLVLGGSSGDLDLLLWRWALHDLQQRDKDAEGLRVDMRVEEMWTNSKWDVN